MLDNFIKLQKNTAATKLKTLLHNQHKKLRVDKSCNAHEILCFHQSVDTLVIRLSIALI